MNTLSTIDSPEVCDVRRCFVLKKPAHDPASRRHLRFLREVLGCTTITSVQTAIRYDVTDLNDDEYDKVQRSTFGEAPVNDNYSEDEFAVLTTDKTIVAQRSQPGQYNQLQDWSEQTILLETGKQVPVRTAECIIIDGTLSDTQLRLFKDYLINTTDSEEAPPTKPRTLDEPLFDPPDIKILEGFTTMNDEELLKISKDFKLSMTLADLHNVRTYFAERKQRNPSVTELKVIDIYWSDHCRHTTFTTELTEFSIDGDFVLDVTDTVDVRSALRTPVQRSIQNTLEKYQSDREELYGDNVENKKPSLMDLALLSMRKLKAGGKLEDMEDSEENNAASIIVPVKLADGSTELWLFMFKNETHNYPTQIEPYGGAATCVGGAIRDPLSGRAYVFMGMRISGGADPNEPIENTIEGTLSQRRISIGAADGYSGYANQIGVPAQKVWQVHHPGYKAKRFECGFVGGAAPVSQVNRERPAAGDVIILLGGRTGRDGVNAASGSSIGLDEKSAETRGPEVQKGNAPEERKIQRLFRNPNTSKLIKRCNDFGAGGVSVAIGELADGLEVNLDVVPLKYKGLDGTEIAISESQERMAVVISRENLDAFLELADGENLEATHVANVNDSNALRMQWRGQTACDLDRDFLNGGWAKRTASVDMQTPVSIESFFHKLPAELRARTGVPELWKANLSRLNVGSMRGLQQQFDSTVGANTIVNPFGGINQLSPSEAAVVKFPIPGTQTAMATSMGFDPELSAQSPFHGAAYAVVDSIARIVASGGSHEQVRLTLQNYFEKLGNDATRWGKPMLAQLGAYLAQEKLGTAAIGGKDSMSGTFIDNRTQQRIDVPPTLVSFAVAPMKTQHTIPSAFQKPNSSVVHLQVPLCEDMLPDWDAMKKMWSKVTELSRSGKIIANHAVHTGGIAAAVSEMSFGNSIGATVTHTPDNLAELFTAQYGSMVVEIPEGEDLTNLFGELPHTVLGITGSEGIRLKDSELSQASLLQSYEQPLESVFPTRPVSKGNGAIDSYAPDERTRVPHLKRVSQPRVSVLALPGTNCEYETRDAFKLAGAQRTRIDVFRNRNREQIEESMRHFAFVINNSEIVAFPGGFSAGDQPDGSGKFGASVLRDPRILDAIEGLKDRGGLVLGVCNGFQILVKSCLLPSGQISAQQEHDATLTHNSIGHFLSFNAMHKAVFTHSPWMSKFTPGETADFPIAHGEGNFINVTPELWDNGQVALVYTGRSGIARNKFPDNPNGSQANIAGITDPSGRIFGMMAHPERALPGLSRNVPTERKGLKIFEGGLEYFD